MAKRDRMGILHGEHPALTRQRDIAAKLPPGPVPEGYTAPRERARPQKPLEGQLAFDTGVAATVQEQEARAHE